MSSVAVARIRLTLAAIVILSSLLAASAWFKNATCGCGSSGLPWQAIATVATVAAGLSIATYAVMAFATRRAHP